MLWSIRGNMDYKDYKGVLVQTNKKKKILNKLLFLFLFLFLFFITSYEVYEEFKICL